MAKESSSLFLSKLSPESTAEDLNALFGRFPGFESTRVRRDRNERCGHPALIDCSTVDRNDPTHENWSRQLGRFRGLHIERVRGAGHGLDPGSHPARPCH